ncbi:hypothetical protein [Spiroplasma endosymbiont of Polydrusus pterygomalis]|uniref:hypothetical protein n=1 Tax=Spiroplasma endosymbiont of Polydrusus pterygomalis TaxID=3139327 RepID=UPI003CCB6EC3
MKKLLSLLSVLTITGTAVPTTIAAISYKKEETIKNGDINYLQNNNLESLNRSKRGINDGNQIEYNERNNNIYASFKPDTWEDIVFLYQNNNKSSFTKKFINKMFDGVWMDKRIENWAIGNLGRTIYENFSTINNKYISSSRRERIRIIILCKFTGWEIWNHDVNIRTDDSNYYPNWRLDNELANNWNRDFNNKTDLGMIDNVKDETILNAVKKQNPNLDISELNIFSKTNFSFLNKEFSVEITAKVNSKKYPTTKKTKFSFISKDFLMNELPNIIGQENLIENWNSNFNEWKLEINRQKMQDVPKYGNDERGQALKRTWKGNHFIELKNKLLSLNHILETIDNKFKINELYKNVQGLQKDINDLKQEVNRLSQEINEIKTILESNKNNEGLEICTKAGSFISATTWWIPFVGTLVSMVSGASSAICNIVNT